MASQAPRVRSLYRRVLRELPFKQNSETLLSHPSALQKHIRSTFAVGSSPEKTLDTALAEVEQFVHYAKAQRTYTTLLERSVCDEVPRCGIFENTWRS